MNSILENSSFGSVYAEHFNRRIRDLLKRPVFEREERNWIDVLQTITKQNKSRILSSAKLTPIQASFKKNEGFVYNKLLDKRKKVKPKFQQNDLVKTAYLKTTISKRETTNWSYKLYKNSEEIEDTIPNYRRDNLPEGYNEALLKITELTMKKK